MNTRVRKCPYCGNELERGFVYTLGSPGVVFLRGELTEKRRNKTLHGLGKEEGSIILDGPYWTRFHETKMLAYACRKCCVVICPYRRPAQADSEPPAPQD